MKPRRIQRKRTKGWRMPPGTVYVGRPTKYGNPLVYELELSAEDAIHYFRIWAMHPSQSKLRKAAREELRGKNLACWCPLDRPCHADVWLEIANA